MPLVWPYKDKKKKKKKKNERETFSTFSWTEPRPPQAVLTGNY